MIKKSGIKQAKRVSRPTKNVSRNKKLIAIWLSHEAVHMLKLVAAGARMTQTDLVEACILHNIEAVVKREIASRPQLADAGQFDAFLKLLDKAKAQQNRGGDTC